MMSLAEVPLSQAPGARAPTTQGPPPSASAPRTLSQPISLASPLVESRSDSYTFPTAAAANRTTLDPEAMLQFFTTMISAHHRRELELEKQYQEKLEAVNSRAKEQAEWAKTAETWSQERAEENRRRKEELLHREHAVLSLERQLRQREALCMDREKMVAQIAARLGVPDVAQVFPSGLALPPILPLSNSETPAGAMATPPQQTIMLPAVTPQGEPPASESVEATPTHPTSPSSTPRRGRPSKTAKAKAVEAATKAAKEAEMTTAPASVAAPAATSIPPPSIASKPSLTNPSPPRGSKRKQPGVTPLCLPPQPAPRPPPRKRISKLALDIAGGSTSSEEAFVVEQAITIMASPKSLTSTEAANPASLITVAADESTNQPAVAGPPKKKTKRQLVVEMERVERQRRSKGGVTSKVDAPISDKGDSQPGEGERAALSQSGGDAATAPISDSSSGGETDTSSKSALPSSTEEGSQDASS